MWIDGGVPVFSGENFEEVAATAAVAIYETHTGFPYGGATADESSSIPLRGPSDQESSDQEVPPPPDEFVADETIRKYPKVSWKSIERKMGCLKTQKTQKDVYLTLSADTWWVAWTN